jgi:hypothetical protein
MTTVHILEVLTAAVLLGLLPAWIVDRKGYSFWAWWGFGTVLPIVALPLALLQPPSMVAFRQCPHCSEWILRSAVACPRCARDVPPQPLGEFYAEVAALRASNERLGRLALMVLVPLSLVVVPTSFAFAIWARRQ